MKKGIMPKESSGDRSYYNSTMEKLIHYIQSKIALTQSEIELIKNHFVLEEIPAQTKLLKAGNVERYIYFLDTGIVKGYQNIDGKIVIQHLVEEKDFFTSLDSFMSETPSYDYYETITDCTLIKMSKSDFDVLQKETNFWAIFVKKITNEH